MLRFLGTLLGNQWSTKITKIYRFYPRKESLKPKTENLKKQWQITAVKCSACCLFCPLSSVAIPLINQYTQHVVDGNTLYTYCWLSFFWRCLKLSPGLCSFSSSLNMATKVSLQQRVTEWDSQNLQLSEARVKDCLGVNDARLLLCEDLEITSGELGMRWRTVGNAIQNIFPERHGESMEDLTQRFRDGQHHYENLALTTAAEERLLAIKRPTEPCRFEVPLQEEQQPHEAEKDRAYVATKRQMRSSSNRIRHSLHHPRFHCCKPGFEITFGKRIVHSISVFGTRIWSC